MEEFRFKRKRLNEVPESKILTELEKAAKHFDYTEFAWRDFNKIADISATTVKKHFGSWKSGLAALKKNLQTKGLDLRPRPFAPNRVYSDKEMFDEMARIWAKVGQRPSRYEWEESDPKIAYQTYKQRFGGWTNSCMKFIEYKMGSAIHTDEDVSVRKETVIDSIVSIRPKPESSRAVPLSVRLKVLDKDNFRCRFCGRSPASEMGVKLHIDHIIPFSKGGKTVVDNLQTLCFDCNMGKSNKEVGSGIH